MNLIELLHEGHKRGASDLHYGASSVPYLRITGEMVALDGYGAIAPEIAREEIMSLCSLGLEQEVDGLIEHEGVRARYHAFRHTTGISVAFRIIPAEIPRLNSLGMPASISQAVEYTQGMVLVAGMTGAGKSTTLASLVQEINSTRRAHIVTIEDPVEFAHPSILSLVHQREVGLQTQSFSQAVRAALREDPDVILIGELRDQETMELALSAAETGHLVLASVHARSAVSAVERVINGVSPECQMQARTMLAESLCLCLHQELIVGRGGRRVPLVESLVGTSAVRTLIREGKTHQLTGVMQASRREGMQTAAMHRGVLREQQII